MYKLLEFWHSLKKRNVAIKTHQTSPLAKMYHLNSKNFRISFPKRIFEFVNFRSKYDKYFVDSNADFLARKFKYISIASQYKNKDYLSSK